MSHLTTWTANQIAAEYRAAYKAHLAMIGTASGAELARSADWLRALKAAFKVANEAP